MKTAKLFQRPRATLVAHPSTQLMCPRNYGAIRLWRSVPTSKPRTSRKSWSFILVKDRLSTIKFTTTWLQPSILFSCIVGGTIGMMRNENGGKNTHVASSPHGSHASSYRSVPSRHIVSTRRQQNHTRPRPPSIKPCQTWIDYRRCARYELIEFRMRTVFVRWRKKNFLCWLGFSSLNIEFAILLVP